MTPTVSEGAALPGAADATASPQGRPQTTDGLQARSYPRAVYAYAVTAMLMLAYIFAFVDRSALSLVIDPIRHDLKLSDTQVSILVGFAFVACFVLFSFPFGRWVDRGGRRFAVATGVTIWSCAMAVCGLASGFWPLFAGRMLVGAGEASVNPAAYSMIPDLFPARRRGLAMAIYASGSAMGGGLAIFLGSLLLKWAQAAHPVLPLIGAPRPWQVMFICLGLPGLLVALLFLLAVREPRRHELGQGPAPHASLGEAVAYFRAHTALFTLIFLGFSGFAVSGYAFTVWGPAFFMRVHHLSVTQAGLLVGVGFSVFGTAGMLVGGLWSDRAMKAGHLHAPVRVALRVAALQLPLFLGAYLSPWTLPSLVLFCAGMFCAWMSGGLQGQMVQVLTPNRLRGQAGAAFLTTVNLIGLGVAPTLTALMTDYVFKGPRALGFSLAATTLVSLLTTVLLLVIGMPLAARRAAAVHEA